MVLSNLTKPEIDYYLDECNFTDREKQFFLLRTCDSTLEDCIEIMSLSPSTIDRISKMVKQKINVVKR